jgi:D-sedoheptulose 7-phosphate isomerase
MYSAEEMKYHSVPNATFGVCQEVNKRRVNMLELKDLNNLFNEHNETFKAMQTDSQLQYNLYRIIELITNTLKNNRKVLICGNGGSAADSQHLAAEFQGRFKKERKALNVDALTTNTSILTAIGNDYSFDKIFARQVEAKGNEYDVLIGLTTSGNSKDVIEAFKQGIKQDMINIAITGNFDNMECEKIVDFILKVPSKDTARIQEATIFLYHVIAEFVEKEFE